MRRRSGAWQIAVACHEWYNVSVSELTVQQDTADPSAGIAESDGAVFVGSEAHGIERVCVVCGVSIATRRRQARFCSGSRRAEASRIQAILSGSGTQPYRSLAERLDVRRNRTQRA